MERMMAVVTAELRYSERFCEYVNRKNKLALTAVAFENTEECRRFGEKHRIELLILEKDMDGTDAKIAADDIRADRIIYLSGRPGAYGVSVGAEAARDEAAQPGDIQSPAMGAGTFSSGYGNSGFTLGDSTENGETILSKYQAAGALLDALIELTGPERVLRLTESIDRKVCIIGVYSPISRCGKTSFALTLAKLVSRKHKTLYMGLEEFSPLKRFFAAEKTAGISEAVYELRQQREPESIIPFIVNMSGIDSLAPAADPGDMGSIGGDDYKALTGWILRKTDYEYLIIDMERYAGQADELLDICSCVYVPYREDIFSRSKLEEFFAYMEEVKSKAWMEKVKKLRLPDTEPSADRSTYLDKLFYGEMGDLVRTLGIS